MIKNTFRENGITTCEFKLEMCVKNNFLGFAHKRRRNTLTPEETIDPHFVVLGCNPCHEYVDREMKKEKAEKLMDDIIAKRGW